MRRMIMPTLCVFLGMACSAVGGSGPGGSDGGLLDGAMSLFDGAGPQDASAAPTGWTPIACDQVETSTITYILPSGSNSMHTTITTTRTFALVNGAVGDIEFRYQGNWMQGCDTYANYSCTEDIPPDRTWGWSVSFGEGNGSGQLRLLCQQATSTTWELRDMTNAVIDSGSSSYAPASATDVSWRTLY